MNTRFAAKLISMGFIITSLAAACSQAAPLLPTATPRAGSATPASQPVEATTTPQPADSTATPTPTPIPSIWVSPSLPEAFSQALTLPPGLLVADDPQAAAYRLEVSTENPVAGWVYAVVAPFDTITDGVSSEDLHQAWTNDAVSAGSSGPFAGHPLLMDVKTVSVLEAWWGRATPGAVKVVPAADLLDYAWDHAPTWAIVPFEALEPRWKVLEVDGVSPLRHEFDPAVYALTVPISLSKNIDQPVTFPATNRDPNKLTTVVLTGVTALVRDTANLMYRNGTNYPAEDIGPLLRDADITHISNEIPFAENCPLYYLNPSDQLVFCTNVKYLELLETVGTDVVELTGDHFADYGPEATLYTLRLYREKGWPYYGGGENLADAQRPVLFEHNGNKIAFIGCNAKGGGYATADATTPGAGECDFDYMEQEIKDLRQQGYLVIATFQHLEIYKYTPPDDMQADFYRLAKAGAVIVSGSQAHQPHGMAFSDGAFIHFGLGNLFFDQFNYFPEQVTDHAFIDRHIFYEGRYISTELLTLQFLDRARSRLMTPEERFDFLSIIFKASGWGTGNE